MRRYFKSEKEKQVMMIEYSMNSILDKQSIEELFEGYDGIEEINKREYVRLEQQYKRENITNMKLIISR